MTTTVSTSLPRLDFQETRADLEEVDVDRLRFRDRNHQCCQYYLDPDRNSRRASSLSFVVSVSRPTGLCLSLNRTLSE